MNSRERLLVLMYETKDPAKKAAIEKRIKAMDKERADRKSTAVTDTLEVPLKMLRKSLSGNEDEWFGPDAETTPGGRSFSQASAEWGIPALSEEAKEQASDFAGGVTDVLADPLNFVGPGLYAKGAKAVNKIAGKGAGKGMLTAPADNYIDNFYVPRESGENTLLEKAAKPILSKTKQGKNLNPEQMVGASQRAVSTGKTVARLFLTLRLTLWTRGLVRCGRRRMCPRRGRKLSLSTWTTTLRGRGTARWLRPVLRPSIKDTRGGKVVVLSTPTRL